MSSVPVSLIPLRDEDLQAAFPGWPFSAWATSNLIRRGKLGCVVVGPRRKFLTVELMKRFIDEHIVPAVKP
jgi:hypothetical protein